MKRRTRWIALVPAVVLMAVTFAAPPARAVENETFGLVPYPEKVDGTPRRTFGIPLEPGAVFEDAVRIYNRTEQPLQVIVYAADAEAGLDGTISVGFRGSRSRGVGSWIDLSGETITIPGRGEAFVSFHVEVRSADPNPDLGAIAVEASERGVAANLAERLHIVVRTTAPNSPTTSVRVKPLLLRSPWIILALLGLLVALIIVWLGARRARRPKDALVASGDLDERAAEPEDAPPASKPVLRRLGETQQRTTARRRQAVEVGARQRRARENRPAPKPEDTDVRPMLDDMLIAVDDEPEPEPAPERAKETPRPPRKTSPRASKPNAPKPARKQEAPKRTGRFIPLDDL